MYKIILFVVLICSLTSCKSFKIQGEGKNCFTKNEARQLGNDKIDFKIFSVAPIIKSKSNCVGLYQYAHINRYISAGVKSKVLKFENEIYAYTKSDTILNNQKLDLFLKTYSSHFNKDEINSIKTKFLKGDEIYGRLY